MILAKRLDRGVQMIAHDRAVHPAAQPRHVTATPDAARSDLSKVFITEMGVTKGVSKLN